LMSGLTGCRRALRRIVLSTELLIITHGEARRDRAAIVGARNGDTGLTRYGLAQATERAKRLLDHLNDGDSGRILVYTGRHERLLKTARIFAVVLDTPMTATAALDGHRYGADVDGRPWVDLTTCHPGQRIVVIGESAAVEASMRRFAVSDVEGRRAGTACEPAGPTFWREELKAAVGCWLLVHHNGLSAISRAVHQQIRREPAGRAEDWHEGLTGSVGEMVREELLEAKQIVQRKALPRRVMYQAATTSLFHSVVGNVRVPLQTGRLREAALASLRSCFVPRASTRPNVANCPCSPAFPRVRGSPACRAVRPPHPPPETGRRRDSPPTSPPGMSPRLPTKG
jgi:broad specificity phosphatase PhoE